MSLSHRTSRLGRGHGIFRENALDLFQIAAHDGGVNVVASYLRVASEDAQSGPLAPGMRCRAIVKDWIGASVFQKEVDTLRVGFVGDRLIFESLLELGPTCKTVFQRERVLYVAQSWFRRRIRIDAAQTSERPLACARFVGV